MPIAAHLFVRFRVSFGHCVWGWNALTVRQTHWRRTRVWLAAVLLLAGCTQTPPAPIASGTLKAPSAYIQQRNADGLERTLERQLRVWRIGSRLRMANAEFCDDTRYTFGFFAVDSTTFVPKYAAVAPDIGLDPGVRIWGVRTAFGDTRASLMRGDRIIGVDANPVFELRSFEAAMAEPFRTGKLLLSLQRGDAEGLEAQLDGRLACDYRIAVVTSDIAGTFVDGRNIFITSSMLDWTQSDDELALVIAHELAHSVLGHAGRKRFQAMIGALADFAVFAFSGVYTGLFELGGRSLFAGSMESAADEAGLVFAARAGFDVAPAPALWERLASAVYAGTDIEFAKRHPMDLDRFKDIQNDTDRILRMQKQGEPLLAFREPAGSNSAARVPQARR